MPLVCFGGKRYKINPSKNKKQLVSSMVPRPPSSTQPPFVSNGAISPRQTKTPSQSRARPKSSPNFLDTASIGVPPLLNHPRCTAPNMLNLMSTFSILYQRGIYPPESFTRVEKYGLGMLVTKEEGLKNYLNNVIKQLKGTRPMFIASNNNAA